MTSWNTPDTPYASFLSHITLIIHSLGATVSEGRMTDRAWWPGVDDRRVSGR